MKKNKAAILSLDPRNKGGILSSLQALYHYLEKKGYQPTVFFLNFTPPHAMSLRYGRFTAQDQGFNLFGMRCFGIGARFAFWEPWHYQATLPAWEKALSDYDLFFVSSGTPFAAHPLVLLGKKFILWVATPFWEDRCDRLRFAGFSEKAFAWLSKNRLAEIEKEILQAASVILPMSNYAKDKFAAILAARKEMKVCPYPIIAQETTLKDYSQNIVVATGRFTDPRKNLSMLLKSWELIEQAVPNAILIIIGQVDAASKIWLQKSERAYLAEDITNQAKMLLYQKASLALITSWQEGLGITGLEALSCQTSVVSTACGGVSDFVLPGITGELVLCNDHAGMAKAAASLLKDSAKLAALGVNGRNLIKDHFSPEVVEQCWDSALAG